MSEDELAFIAKFAESPDDDLPRLAFCDWLEERDGNEDCPHCDGTGKQRYADAAGDMDERHCPWCNATGQLPNGYATWAAFIRVQIELADLRNQNDEMLKSDISSFDHCRATLWKRIKEAKAREADLMYCAASRLPSLVGKWGVSVHGQYYASTPYVLVARGFIESAKCSLAVWERDGRKLCEQSPIQSVRITDKQPHKAGGLWTWYFFDHPRDAHDLPMWLCPLDRTSLPAYFPTAADAYDFLSHLCIRVARGPRPDPKAWVTPKRILH